MLINFCSGQDTNEMEAVSSTSKRNRWIKPPTEEQLLHYLMNDNDSIIPELSDDDADDNIVADLSDFNHDYDIVKIRYEEWRQKHLK
ncbi:hypothetical protein JTB14_030491 [Gonioctena quinquepunctata]|nr:hypothetical protein JTB14_030491 [Gonioctena quinquepunctata]